jgi:hypothetical protein
MFGKVYQNGFSLLIEASIQEQKRFAPSQAALLFFSAAWGSGTWLCFG